MTDPSPDRPRPPLSAPRPGDPRPAEARPLEAVRAAVEDAMATLDAVSARPAAEHVAAFEAVHAALGEALAAGTPVDQVAGRA
jgi:hypothetical protein